jgi:hypothetical protein
MGEPTSAFGEGIRGGITRGELSDRYLKINHLMEEKSNPEMEIPREIRAQTGSLSSR